MKMYFITNVSDELLFDSYEAHEQDNCILSEEYEVTIQNFIVRMHVTLEHRAFLDISLKKTNHRFFYLDLYFVDEIKISNGSIYFFIPSEQEHLLSLQIKPYLSIKLNM